MSFCFRHFQIPGLIAVEPQAFRDTRGIFVEAYKRSEFTKNGIPDVFVQDNFSYSKKGVIRGLHYQTHPKAQAKLVAAVQGTIFDVAVDIRQSSLTYGKWLGVILSAENRTMLYVPAGFAHGFCVLSEEAGVLYKVTDEYAPDCERGILWNDPDIGISWPIAEPNLSQKDRRLPVLRQAEDDFVYKEIAS